MRVLLLAFLLSLTSVSYSSVTIGVLPYNPPFEVAADKEGHFFGFDIDIMTSICQRINMECHFVSGTLSELFTMLSQGQIDLAMGALTITPARKKTYIFSLPYLASYGHFFATKKYALISDLKGQRVGVLKGSLYRPLTKKMFNDQVNVIEFKTSVNVVDALIEGKVDAAFMDEGSAKYWVAANNEVLHLIGEHYKVGMGYGIMTTKNQQDLIKKINQALMAIEADGTYIKIYNRYFSQLLKSE